MKERIPNSVLFIFSGHEEERSILEEMQRAGYKVREVDDFALQPRSLRDGVAHIKHIGKFSDSPEFFGWYTSHIHGKEIEATLTAYGSCGNSFTLNVKLDSDLVPLCRGMAS